MPTNAEFRQTVYTLMIVASAGLVAGRILSVNFNYEPYLHRDPSVAEDTKREWPKVRPKPMPTFSSNDRSRWATIRVLVDDGTYQIGERTITDPATGAYKDSGITFEEGWGGVDKVMHPETRKFYSSKPPLLPTLLAGEYWLLKQLLGWNFQTHLFAIVRTVLLTVNWLPLILYWVLLARLIDRFGGSDWGRLYALAAGCFGTFLTTFAITLNNHTIAACTGLFALYLAVDLWTDPATQPLWRFALAGLLAAFTAAVELPAMAFLVGLGCLLLWRAPRQTLLGFVPPVLLVVAAGLLTNYLAIGRLTPAYAEVGAKSEWYLYAGSHWLEVPGKEKTGIDFAWKKETRPTYMFHFLFGHHGIFSLSPIFLLSVVGIWLGVRRGLWGESPAPAVIEPDGPSEGETAAAVEPPASVSNPGILERLRGCPYTMIALLTAYLTVVVVGFYLVKTNNYGGWCSGPRWVFWLTPFWLLTMLPAVDWLATRRWGRALALVFLCISVASVSYPAWNPWRMPWIYQWLDAYGLIPY
ncbi:MAG: DUF2029 domain-containing protein [Planctomycetia bacterium]|nr:DUF2029 domain-containing protein [Planctomycetia bacterium]